jgi:hypothetical protein
MYVDFQQQEPLLRLTQLPALQTLLLFYAKPECAAGNAPAWARLLQLKFLDIKSGHTTRQQMAGIEAGAAAATTLERFFIRLDHPVGAADQPAAGQQAAADGVADAAGEPLAVCASIARLTNLVRLELNLTPMARGDALALTALTGLSHLSISAAKQRVGDVAATALAVNMTRLRHLDLEACDLGYMACLAAVARLTRLTTLSLRHNPGLTEEGLMLLTRLSRLQELHVNGCEGVDEGVLARFWAAVRGTSG